MFRSCLSNVVFHSPAVCSQDVVYLLLIAVTRFFDVLINTASGDEVVRFRKCTDHIDIPAGNALFHDFLNAFLYVQLESAGLCTQVMQNDECVFYLMIEREDCIACLKYSEACLY